MVVAEYESTPEYFLESAKRGRATRASLPIWLIPSVLGLVGVFMVAVNILIEGSFGGVLMGLFLVAYGVGIPWLLHMSKKRVLNRLSLDCNAAVRIEFDEEGLHTVTGTGDSNVMWSAYTQVAYFKDGYLLLHGKAPLIWIPKSSIQPPSATVELEALFQAHITNHRVMRNARKR